MTKTRRLADLYAVGKEITIGDDGPEEPVVVYLRKISPLDHSTAVRKANAARARLLGGHGDRAEDERAVLTSELETMSRDALIETLIDEEIERFRLAREAEVASADEWSDEGHLQGLRDAWEDGLQIRWAAGEKDDSEVIRVFDELKRFEEQVDAKLDGERHSVRRDLDSTETPELIDRALKSRLKMMSDLIWVNEFRKYEVFFSVRDRTKRSERYFRDFDEVEELDTQVLIKLITEYQLLQVPALEGKDSPETPAS